MNPPFLGGIVNFSFAWKQLSFLHSLHVLLKWEPEKKSEMVSFWRVTYSFCKGGISLLKFVPRICSLALDGNTNPGYLDMETMLSTPLAVEMTKQQTTQESRREMQLVKWKKNTVKKKNPFPNILRSTQTNPLKVSGFPS